MDPEYIERFNAILGASLEQSVKEITVWYKKLKEAYELKDRSKVRELLTEETHSHLSQFRECFKLGILLHYFIWI